MAKDFMQDILPKDESRPTKIPIHQKSETPPEEIFDADPESQESIPERSIRNISVNRPRTFERAPLERPIDRREVPPVGGGMPRPRSGNSSLWLWAIAAILLAVFAVLALFMF